MNTQTAVLVGLVVVLLVGGVFMYMRQQQAAARPNPTDQIGAGIGSLVAGIIGAATQ